MKSDTYLLTGAKRKAAEMLSNGDFLGTNDDIINACGISRDTFYRWKREPEFLDAVNKMARQNAKRSMGKAYGALSKKAETGDVGALRLLFKATGEDMPDNEEEERKRQENAEMNEQDKLELIAWREFAKCGWFTDGLTEEIVRAVKEAEKIIQGSVK